MQFRAFRKLQNLMGTTRRTTERKKNGKTGVDCGILPPWYLFTYMHGTNDDKICSHVYLYSNTAIYGPDITVKIEYDPKTDNTRTSPKLKVEHHAY